MKKITATDLARRLSDVLNRVRYQHEEFLVERGGDPVAAIVPIGSASDVTFAEFLRLLAAAPRPDPDFADDLERIQNAQPPALEELPKWLS
ncbi:MAG: type II toxin-antitoxin system Phd/YefM family antitoxin [bacterium]